MKKIYNILLDRDTHKYELEQLGFSFEIKEIIPPCPHPFGNMFPMLDERIIYNATIPGKAIIKESINNPKYWKYVMMNEEVIATIFSKLGQYTSIS